MLSGNKQEPSVYNTSISLSLSNDSIAFDPTPFVQALEQAVDELIPLRKDVTVQTKEAEKQVEAAERQYAAKVKELRDNFNVRLILLMIQDLLTGNNCYYLPQGRK